MNKNLKQPKTVGGRHCRPNNLVMSFLRTMLFLAVMVIGTGSAWGDVSLGKVTIGSTITPNTSTEQNFGNNGVIAAGGTTDLSLTAKFKVADSGHPDVTCENNKIDLSKISGFGNLTYNYDGNKASVTISQENQYGNGILIKFAKAQDMSHVKTITINGGIKFGDIPFTDGTTNWWPSQNFADGKTIINTNCNSQYTAITEIRLRPGNTTESFEISSIVFEFDHTPATPQFIDGTTAEMTISQGDDITLSVDNSSAFWREFQDANYVWNQQIYDRIPSNEYNTPVRKITGLEIGDYYFAAQVGRTCEFDKWHGSELAKVHVRVTEAFNPALDLNSSDKGDNVVSYTDGVLTVKGGSNNVVKVKDVTGQGNNYTGIRLTTQGKACRLIVRWGPDDNTERSIKVIDAAEKATTSYYSWSMLGVPENKIASISDIYFAGANDYSYSETNTGVTKISNASLVNVTETTPYTRVVGELREFNLNDTRVQLYGHESHYKMGGNIEWVYKEETSGNKFVTMKTTDTSWNQMEIFNSGHGIPTYDGIHIDFKGQHFRVIAYKGDETHVYTVPASTDKITARFVTWADLGITDPAGLTRVEVAGCSEHSSEESVNFYGIRLYKSLRDIIYTDESVNEGTYNGNLAYRESHDGKDMSVVFKNITGDDRANDCQGTIVNKGPEHGFTIEAPGCYNIKKVFVGLGENSTSTVLFNNNNVYVNNQNQIEWTNTATSSTVTMTIPNDAANVLHVKYVYYELEEIKIPSIEVNGQTRQYIVYAPDGIKYSESSKVGVIFSLHGASNDYWNGRVDFNAIAEAKKNVDGKKFIVVYPRGLMRQLRGQERGWETYTESNTEDVEFFKAIVTELKKTYSVDMSRIYLAGFSNGGMMAYKAAHQAGDFFAAFASVGGFPVNESHLFHAGSQPTPFIHIQGADDDVFSSKTYDLSTIAHNMTYRNGAHFNPYDEGHNSDGGVVPAHENVKREIHVADNGGAAYFLYTITGMGHTWSYNWDGNAGDDVAQSIWNFFDYSGKVNNIDKALKFRMDDPNELWSIATTGKSSQNVKVGYIGFDKVNQTVDEIHYVLSYGGRTKTDNGTTFDKDSNNKNLWHSLQFNGGINGAPHYLKLNVETNDVGGAANENAADYFLVKLTKTGASTPVFAKRYQAGRGKKDLYINFVALPGFNEYKLEVTKSRSDLVVKVHGMEFYSGRCEDKEQEENPVFFYDVASVLTGMNPIYQPIFGKSYNGIAKEYLPIAEIPVGKLNDKGIALPSDIDNTDYKVIENDLKNSDDANAAVMTSLPSTVIKDWGASTTATISRDSGKDGKLFNIAVSGKPGEDANHKSNNAFIFVPDKQTYTIDKVKGINISQLGRAKMPEYLNGTEGSFPTKGMIAIKLQGTLDFYLLAQNEVTYTGTDPNPARRTLKVYYTNDQLDGELKELKEWWFFGTRSENGYNDENGQSLAALSAGVRLPQLGMDGTCTVFITYEGNGQGQSFSDAESDHDKIWIKGFVIKRPDLKVTIGRTDSKYSSQDYNGEDNTKCTRFGENKPYVWSFENVGFNNTKKADITKKKINAKDGRTYVCGGTDDSNDHVLLYSDGASDKNEDKVQFDGRVAGQEHIEFLKASQYNIPEATDDRKIYDPIQSNGLKVNVTGSGWFKIQCAAPNGPVNMKVYTQPNYGSSYISLLREFRVEKTSSDTDWKEYTVYLKSRGIHAGNNGFWDGETADAGKEEIMRQSLFVVFDNIDNVSYDEGHPQLNIHQLSWLNEEPADYVFQREEDPKLLTEWQEIKRNDKTVLYWKAGNDDDADYTVLKGHEKGSYNVINQINTDNASKGVKSPDGYASTSVPSDAGAYNAYWDIAAPARVNALVEKAYGNDQKQNDTQYAYNSGNNTEFDTPVSGSFIRISAMQNTYVVAHVIPGNTSVDANATPHSGATVYVLDETGNPIPSSSSDEAASRLGYIAAMVNGGIAQDGGVASQDKTIRIDICANAGKEYFICAKDASISLARLEVHDWRYKPAKGETLALTDNNNNSTAIAAAYDAGKYYMDATLTRTFAAGKWASLVLPFSLNEQKFKEVFGENAKCIHFTDVDKEKNIVKLTHHYYNMIVAGRPVFIYTPAQVVNPQFKDITLQTKDVKNTTTESGFTFHASYDGTQMKWNDLYMNNANAIKYVSNDKSKQLTYPGMRSFIQSPNEYDPSDGRAGSAGAKAVFLSFLDDDYQDIPTGIEELISAEFGEDVVVVTKTTKIYDLLGNVMGEGSDINSLPAGIYIVNGKKYIVK